VASFLTSNLTVAYLLGALFNGPLVFAMYADVLFGRQGTILIKQWSIGERLGDFTRGILSFAGIFYFLVITVVALYVCMVLISRRHWVRGRDAVGQATQFAIRALALVVVGVALNVFFQNHNPRADISTEQLSSLSPETLKLLANLKLERPVQIEAFVSPEVPEVYVQTRLNLLAMLRGLEARGGAKVRLQITPTERFSEEAQRAEKRYGITAHRVMTTNRGTMAEDFIYLGVAMNCGLEKVILPFIDRGIPVEYELVRSICTVTEQKRKKIGVLQTDAQLYAQFDMQSMSPGSNWPIIDELEKQYDVSQVDATNPITEHYDALLAVQPSSLTQEQMDHFVAAIKGGMPTVIFEDPFPVFAGNVPGTSAPKRPPGGMNPMMGMQQQPPTPKGDRTALWNTLGINFTDDQIVWQNFCPDPKLASLVERDKEFVFVGQGSGAKQPFGDGDPASSGLQKILMPFPGAMTRLNTSDLKFTPLLTTGDKSGTVRYGDMLQQSFMGPTGLNPDRRRELGGTEYVLAAHIQGHLKGSMPMAAEESNSGDKAKNEKKPAPAAPLGPAGKSPLIDVIVVADIDMLNWQFFRMREAGDMPEQGFHTDFDNVTFVLNCLDEVAGDNRFLAIRKRRPIYRTLIRIEEATADARKKNDHAFHELEAQYEKTKRDEDAAFTAEIDKIKKRIQSQGANVDLNEVSATLGLAQQTAEQRKEAKLAQAKQELDRRKNEIDTEWNVEVRRLQDWYKLWAVLLPPIPPLAVALAVFLNRRWREREGVARSRLRS
jgi:ABC-2 type transport system permease protein